MAAWTSLPSRWSLEGVQAGLNVLITGLSALAIFVYARFCWKSGASQIANNNSVPIPSILTLNTPGEVIDVWSVLKDKLPKHRKILTQSVVVILFSTATLISGPVARYATRITSITRDSVVDGFISARSHNSNGDDQVMWNLTHVSLEHAGFPTDQLLDYLPSTTSQWIYRPEEWNNTWKMNCVSIDSTPVNITMTNNCSQFSSKMLGRDLVIPAIRYSDYSYNSHGDYYVNSTIYRDVLVFSYAANYSNYNNATGIHHNVDMSLAALHMHHAPKNTSIDSRLSGSCAFGIGPVESLSFTRIDCSILYSSKNSPDSIYTGHPDTGDVDAIPSAFRQYYFARFKQESIRDTPVTIIGPNELQRFFQVYIVTKDVQDRLPVNRTITVEVKVVQISTTFLVFYLIVALLVVLAGVNYAVFLLRNRRIVQYLPQSKLDWIFQAIEEVSRNQVNQTNRPDWRVIIPSDTSLTQDRGERRTQTLFQKASCGRAIPEESQQAVVNPNKMEKSPATLANYAQS